LEHTETHHAMEKKVFTNCFLVKNDGNGNPVEVCLAMKKRGFGQGMWNGSGGKPKEKESIEDAAIREAEEELRVKVIELSKRGMITFILREEDKHVIMYAFLATNWTDEPMESEEMKPQWFSIDSIPYDQMWKADREWLPLIFSGKKIQARYTYAREGGEVETSEIEIIEKFD
jgi:8-oxo-dGTP diphosphatase/2-hydroxy-dATP diphosphatase